MIKEFFKNRQEKKLQKEMERDYYNRTVKDDISDDISGDGFVITYQNHNIDALETTRKKFNRPDFIPEGIILNAKKQIDTDNYHEDYALTKDGLVRPNRPPYQP